MTAQALYRFYDAAGSLLYVGITMNPAQRWRDHRKDKPWWSQVARIDLETYPNRAAVGAAEVAAIRAERPLYNVKHNGRFGRPEIGGKGGNFHRWGMSAKPAETTFPQVTTQKVHPQVRAESVPSVEISTFPPKSKTMAEGLVGPGIAVLADDEHGGLCLLCWQRRRHIGVSCFSCLVGLS